MTGKAPSSGDVDGSGRTIAAGTPLPRLGRAKLSDLASDTLLSRIVRGVWKPGERLPSERQLSEQLAMSRASIREALRGLEAMGLVQVRHGQGVFVREGGEGQGFEGGFFAGWQSEHTYAIGELLAFRLLIEPELAALAAAHADPQFVKELNRTLDAMEEAAAAADLDLLVKLDTAFHDAVNRRAGNRLYSHLLDHIAQLSIDSRRISLGVPGRAIQVVAAHRAVAGAIAMRDPASASAAMRRHLEKFATDLQVRPMGYGMSGGTR